MKNSPIGILLAAGKSQRFGSNKLLYPVTDNTPMLLLCAQKLATVLPGSVVVISETLQNQIPQLERLDLQVVINEHAEQGMGTSIACGVRASQEASGWLITLADMPYIKLETMTRLVNSLKAGARIVAPEFEQQRGHPVGLSHIYLDALLSLNQDTGAKHIIKNNLVHLELIETDDEGVIQDVDYPLRNKT